MNDLLYKKLEDICLDEKRAIISGPFGSNISSKYFVDKGIPVIRGNNLSLSLDKFYDEGFVYVTKKKADELNCYAKKLDIIFTAAGTIGQVGLITNDTKYDCYVISNKQIRARLDPNKIDILYAYYWFTSPWIQKYLTSNNKGSTVPLLSLWEVKNLPIIYPKSMSKQKKISNIIDKISKKIELNNKINDELEVMAKTVYDYWFLQFEFPNEEGKPYKSSGGKMVWNEELKREIPEGWEVNKLEEYISVIRGVNYKRDDVLSNKETNYIPLIKSNNIQNGQILFDDIIFVPQKLVNKNQILSKNSVLMTMSSGSKEHMGKTTIIYDSLDYTFGAFCSKIEIIEDMRCFLSIFFRSALFKTLIDNITSGTNINNISNEHLYNIKMTIPNKKVLQKFEDILNPILDKQGIIQKENQELTSLRDFLLPLLMNGQVGFKEDKAEG